MSTTDYLTLLQEGEGQAPAAANPYLDMLRAEADQQTTRLRASATQALGVDPDKAALAKRVAGYLGTTAPMVQALPAEAERAAKLKAIDDNTAQTPVLRARYTDTDFAKLAHDDSGPLARFEQTAAPYTFGSALRKGIAGGKLTLDFMADQLARAVGADRTETQRILHETAGYYVSQGSDPQLQAAGERAKAAGEGTWYGTLLHLPGEVAAESNPMAIVGRFMTEQLPVSLVGFGLGAVATAPVRSAIASRIASEMVARGVSASLAGAAGNGTAVVVQSLGANYTEGLGQGLDPKEAAARAWTKTLSEVPANAVAGAAMGLKIGPNQLTNILGQAAVQGAGGGTGAAMASVSVGETPDPVEIALEILGEAVSAGPEVAGLTYSRIAGSRTVHRAEVAQAAVNDAQQVDKIIKAADATALKTRDPETFAQLVEHIQPDAALYIAPEHLAGVDLSAVPHVAAQVAEAQANGGDVQMSLADVLAHLPGEQLLPHLRVAPEAMTLSEAQAFDGAAELQSETSAPAPASEALLSAPQQAGMSADAWAAYTAAADESAQLALAARDARALRDMQWLVNAKSKAAAELRAEAEAARAQIEAELRAELRTEPAYAARRWLASGELPDGTQTVGAKLDTQALREIFGDGPAAPWRYLPSNLLASSGGMHPDMVAEMFGFDSGDALVRALLATEPEHAAVERMADERMREQHPDIVDAIGRARSAEALIADRARARFLATEAAALSKAIGNKVELERAAHRYAEESIGRRKVREVRPAQFKAAAERAGRKAGLAFQRGETLMAAKHKRSQALQEALHAEGSAAVVEIERALATFKRIAKADDGARDGAIADAARAVLAQYGLANSENSAADYLAKVEHYDPELHADLLLLMDGLPAPAADYRELTVSEFRAVRDRVKALWSLARTTRQIEIDGQAVEIADAAGALAQRLDGEAKAKPESMVGTNKRLDLRMRLAGMRAALRRVEFWADARDRGDKAGPFRTYVWQPVSEAVTRYRAQRNEYVGRFLELLKPIEPTLKPGKIAAPELGDGVVFADRSALLHALLHLGNESNMRKLLLGYEWATQREDGSLDTTRWDAFLRRMHDEGRITQADWRFVQSTWNLLEEIKPSAQAAHKRMFGSYFDEITAEPVQTPFGELAGGYVPAITDSLRVPESRTHGAMDEMLASQNSPMFPAVNRGFTKGRVETYTRPLALDLRLLPAHIDKVARFATLGPVLRDTARLVTRNRTFREAMNAVDPTAIESMLVPWLKRTATQTLNKAPETHADRAVARIANAVRQRTGLLLMAGNVVNTLQQITGLSAAALRVNPGHLAAGLLQYVRNPQATARAINELSPWMQQRSDNSARDVAHAIDEMLTNPNALQRVEEFGTRYGYVLQQAAQNFVDRAVWLGAYRQAEAGGVTDAQAVRDADSAVRMTQSSFAPEDAAKVEHAGAFTRLFLMFFSYFSGQANLIATETVNAKGQAARLALVYLLGFAVPAFVADVIGKGLRGDLGDDDGEGLAEQLLKSFFLSQARYALGMVPVAGQVGNAALGQFTPERFDDRIGASPAYSALEATVRAPRSIYRAATGEGNPKAAVRDGLTAVGVLTGLPTGPLVRPLGYLADENRDGITVRGLVTGTE